MDLVALVVVAEDHQPPTQVPALGVPRVPLVTDGQIAFWLRDVPVHAVGADLEEAEVRFLDALVDYADLWFHELRYAANHAQHQHLALRVAMYAGNREELRRVVFGED